MFHYSWCHFDCCQSSPFKTWHHSLITSASSSYTSSYRSSTVSLLSISVDILRIFYTCEYIFGFVNTFLKPNRGRNEFWNSWNCPWVFDDLWFAFDKTKHRHSVLWVKNISLKKIYTVLMSELQAIQYLAEPILFCLEGFIHFKMCTWRQIIVNLKAKDYSFEGYINSENRVVSLWYSIWRVEWRGEIQSGFLFLRRRVLSCWRMLSDILNTKNTITERDVGSASCAVRSFRVLFS